MTDEGGLLFSDDQAAKYLGISTRTYQRLRHEGLIEYVRVSERCVRTEKRALDAHMAARSFRSRAAELANAPT